VDVTTGSYSTLLPTKFTVPNFLFSPFTSLGEPPHHPPYVFRLTFETHSVDVEIRPVPDYVESAVKLQQTRGVLPTP
jgi:hypothetical protein